MEEIRCQCAKLEKNFYMIGADSPQWLVYEMTESVGAMQQQALLTDTELLEFEKNPTEKRKREYLGVRIALKELLGKKILLKYDESGKPFLVGNAFHISISHSKNWIAVIAHPFHRVGIDIECPNDKIAKLYTRFLSADEQCDLFSDDNVTKLHIAWSAKEALFKIIGNSAVEFARQLRVFPFNVAPRGIFKAAHIPTNKIYQLTYQQNSDYTLVYCVDSN